MISIVLVMEKLHEISTKASLTKYLNLDLRRCLLGSDIRICYNLHESLNFHYLLLYFLMTFNISLFVGAIRLDHLTSMPGYPPIGMSTYPTFTMEHSRACQPIRWEGPVFQPMGCPTPHRVSCTTSCSRPLRMKKKPLSPAPYPTPTVLARAYTVQ